MSGPGETDVYAQQQKKPVGANARMPYNTRYWCAAPAPGWWSRLPRPPPAPALAPPPPCVRAGPTFTPPPGAAT